MKKGIIVTIVLAIGLLVGCNKDKEVVETQEKEITQLQKELKSINIENKELKIENAKMNKKIQDLIKERSRANN